MRKQYHLWPAGTGFDAWDAGRLISLSRELPVHAVTADSVREVGTVYWFDDSTAAPTVRAVVEHARLMLDADLSFPVIPGPDGRVMDGMHRIARALLDGRKRVSAVASRSCPSRTTGTASPPISRTDLSPSLTRLSAALASLVRPRRPAAPDPPDRTPDAGRPEICHRVIRSCRAHAQVSADMSELPG
jgi:hypothetical protein